MGMSLEVRFEKYCDRIVNTLTHADREPPARWYIKGLMLPGERKSVEPMAARVQPDNVRSAHQSMHHLVADAPWSDEAMLSAVAGQVLPQLIKADGAVYWIVDDTGFPKKGKDSVGVTRPRRRLQRDDHHQPQELGLGHYAGRNWWGVHHHASLCVAAYGFLALERLIGSKERCSIQGACHTRRLPPAWSWGQCSVMSPHPSPLDDSDWLA